MENKQKLINAGVFSLGNSQCDYKAYDVTTS